MLASLTNEAKNTGDAFNFTGNRASSAGDKFGKLENELKGIETGLQTTKSELNAVNSGFIGAERSTEALSAQNQVLEKYTYDLNDQLRVQQEMLREAAAAYGEADEKTQQYQQAVNNTTAELNKTNAQINENNRQISLNAAQGKGLNGVLGKLGLNVNDLAQKFGLSSNAAGKLTTAFGSGAAAAGVFAAAVVKVIGKLNDFSKAQARHIDEINTLARNYHMTAEQMQQFGYMSALIDVDTQTITGSISRLTRTMASAKEGTGEAAEAFSRLGVSVTNSDGSLRSSNDVFYDIIDALRRINSETEQDALAMQLFGRSAMDLRGVIDEGSDGLKAYADEAERLGVVLSSEANSRLQSLQDESDKVSSVQNAMKENWAAVWAPAAEFFEGVKGGFFVIANEGAKALLAMGDSSKNLASATSNLGNASKVATQEIINQSDALENAKQSANSLLNGYDKLISAWESMEESGLGRVLAQYDPETGVTKRVFASNNEVSAYRSGAASFSDIYSGSYKPQDINISVQLDGRELAKTSYPYMQDESRMRGGALA